MNYSDMPELDGLYLEDSYVLQIIEDRGALTFRVEFVLTESHPLYRPPPHGEQHCYANGTLGFEQADEIDWRERGQQVFSDANGEEDLGNIDYLTSDNNNHWRVGGDWGHVELRTARPPSIVIDPFPKVALAR